MPKKAELIITKYIKVEEISGYSIYKPLRRKKIVVKLKTALDYNSRYKDNPLTSVGFRTMG